MSATDFDVCPQLNRLADGQRDTVVQMFHKMCSESQVVLRQVFMVNRTGMFEIFHNKMLDSQISWHSVSTTPLFRVNTLQPATLLTPLYCLMPIRLHSLILPAQHMDVLSQTYVAYPGMRLLHTFLKEAEQRCTNPTTYRFCNLGQINSPLEPQFFQLQDK